ncbi:hypothetical protein [Clostridium algidicarnis]|uniref:hypothetical protein n=1 Tax=Clostridium algidicarnis TaxID=37659 RepID=UPI001C0E0941|nr:hypothetical protein [Clostridium algidicarnis]MBU3205144.1 hypothetical protein [Clostridium algidicarnis]MBU3213297.1 hypothetical protein [Clostridium algidicarnis]MBU3223808.1 hypothetical protein [Clostridium algidicarnis]
MDQHETYLLKSCLTILIRSMITLIDLGYKKDKREIESHIEAKDIISYLDNEFSSEHTTCFSNLDNKLYSVIHLEEFIYHESYIVGETNSRTFIVEGDENGLLLLLSICYELQSNLTYYDYEIYKLIKNGEAFKGCFTEIYNYIDEGIRQEDQNEYLGWISKIGTYCDGNLKGKYPEMTKKILSMVDKKSLNKKDYIIIMAYLKSVK